jgi:hypothetical protein
VTKFNHGDTVIVADRHGNHEVRGKIVGRHMSSEGMIYDVQPGDEWSMSKRVCGVHEHRLRHAGKPVLVVGAV